MWKFLRIGTYKRVFNAFYTIRFTPFTHYYQFFACVFLLFITIFIMQNQIIVHFIKL